MTNPDLNKARELLSPETMAQIQRAPFALQGWKILERWAAQEPSQLQALEQQGLLVLLTRLLDQQQAEADALTAMLGHDAGLAPHEIISMAGIEMTLVAA
jgi:hypothetical protein